MTQKLFRQPNGTIQVTVDVDNWSPVTYPAKPPSTLTTTQLRNGAWISHEDRAELERKAAAYDELETIMPTCGHKKRYVYGTVTMNCALCGCV